MCGVISDEIYMSNVVRMDYCMNFVPMWGLRPMEIVTLVCAYHRWREGKGGRGLLLDV